MWIRNTKSCNQGLSLYIKGELRDVSEAILKSLPADVYEPESSPYESQVDPAVRARDLAKQTFLRLQQASTLAADKLANAVKAAADAKQVYHAAYSHHESLLAEQSDCADNVTRLAGKTTKKALADFAKQTTRLEELDRLVETARLTTMKLNGLYEAAGAEAELQSRTAEDIRLAAVAAHTDLQSLIAADQAKQEQPVDGQEQNQNQNEPDIAEPEAIEQPKDTYNAEGQAAPSEGN